MAPAVDLMICATPLLPLPARAPDGHVTIELLPSVQAPPTASCRNSVKFAVVPEESERTARVIGVLGRLTPELTALIAGSFQVVIFAWKISEISCAVSLRLLMPGRLYATSIGPIKTGKYSTFLPLSFASSVDGMVESEPA